MAKNKEYFQGLVQKDIEKTVKELLEIVKNANDNNMHNNLIMQSGSLNSLINDNAMGLITQQDYKMGINRIRHALLYIIDNLDDHFEEEEQIITPTTSNNRASQLNELIEMNYKLLHEWEMKKDLSDNPTERMKCELEIEKLKESVAKYENELNSI